MSDDNIWTDEWDAGEDWSGGGVKAKRLPRTERLGATVYELGPGNFSVYHFHHAAEELLVVLDGEMTLKTEEGERLVRRGDVVMFPIGPPGAHGFTEPPKGHHSVFGKSGKSQVQNNEFIVFNRDQHKLRYMIEFSATSK